VNAAVLAGPVSEGIRLLEDAFDGRVKHEPDGEGGAFVVVEEVDLGGKWTAPEADLTFHLAYNYPASAIYPYYLPAEVVPADGSMPPAVQRVIWRDTSVIQVSLRQANWDPRRDNAIGAVMQTQHWLRSL
jgi:hypothetical protein